MTSASIHTIRILATLMFGLGAPVMLNGLAVERLYGSEVALLSKENWADWSPKGKEVDANYGDLVLRNDQIICVIARPIPSRNANMTVKSVGGAIIDLSNRKFSNDQLSAFYPGGTRFSFASEKTMKVFADRQAATLAEGKPVQGKNVSVRLDSSFAPDGLTAKLTYSLGDKQSYVLVRTTITNNTEKPITMLLSDGLRADRSFKFGTAPESSLVWAADEWFRQAYGLVSLEMKAKHKAGRLVTIEYRDGDGQSTTIPAKGQFEFKRRFFPGSHLLRTRGVANRMSGKKVTAHTIEVSDKNGPIHSARVTLKADGKTVGWARTPKSGKVTFPLPAGEFALEVEAIGRPKVTQKIEATTTKVAMETCGYLQGAIVDNQGKPIPCKVAIHAKPEGGGATPFYGPDSAAYAVQNLIYPADGRFKCELAPGEYEVIVSRGPEYDAHFASISVKQNETAQLKTQLKRVVDTSGWVSADFHSHSSPSGDNTGSQLGRVQNLLAENIEFAPCTEHNRVSSYLWHLKRLKATEFMATCSGIELTGNPLPINHQNAFPIRLRPHTQDGGGPLVDINPERQIERLAMWDEGSPKLVQANHPNLVQMLGDKDLNGEYDGGFEGMFAFMDVMEVHPPAGIFTPPTPAPVKQLPRNPMFHWLQMLNLGYRIPGVVNTDAHYNFHGSGWIRNYIKCTTDKPAEIKTMEMVRASEKGLIVMTTGPFMKVEAISNDQQAIPGQNLASDGSVKLEVQIQCANWLDVNRVQVFVNGRPEEKLNFTRRTHPKMFRDKVVKFDETIALRLKEDAHIVVAAIGEGLELGRVAGPRWGKQAPVVVANPIFVDVDGGGFKPNGDLLGLPIPLKK